MKKEDCKVGTLVRVRNGRSVGKIVEVNDETSTLSVAVVPLDRHDSAIWWEPGQLTRLGDLPTRTFCVGDKVRYVPRGRSKYLYEPKKDKIYDVVTRESESGQVGISGHGFNDDINWYDLELVEPVAKLPYYAETGLVRRRKDGECVVTFLYSRLSKETADRLAQMVCDKLNELEGEKA